ncbi:hypothetical protein E2C01_046983 [Portunus trituberculatus]|uniref:Uncharacterized protein n=1 Tax=Portunus trituberculatus TaxID=210409 RepID=A0A5B7G7K9_PORTR|nr:hypothetical protein [Portunus trituberculatus]
MFRRSDFAGQAAPGIQGQLASRGSCEGKVVLLTLSPREASGCTQPTLRPLWFTLRSSYEPFTFFNPWPPDTS